MAEIAYSNKKIKELRIANGLTQEELGKKMGYADRTIINKYECGREITLKKAKEFADFFRVSVSDILGLENNCTQLGESFLNLETAKRLKTIIHEKNIRAVDLSKASGVSQSSLSHYMKGENVPNKMSAEQLAEVLNCNPLWLMGLSDVKEAESTIAYKSREPFAENPQAVSEAMTKLARLNQKHFDIVVELIGEFYRIEEIERL